MLQKNYKAKVFYVKMKQLIREETALKKYSPPFCCPNWMVL